MGSLSAAAVLQLPVELEGIRLGRPIDLLVDTGTWRVLGFVVLCGDDSHRFLPYAAAHTNAEAIEVPSALMLLEDVDFYRQRAVSFRSLLDGTALRGHRVVGQMRDVLLARDGAIVELVVARGDGIRRVQAAGSVVQPTRATAA